MISWLSQMVDRNGNVVNNYAYDEWGNITTGSETVSNPFKYAGEVYDSERELYYLRVRYYHLSIGRFINEDSFEGKTTYEYIMYPRGYSKFKPWHWFTRSKIINARKKYGI